MEAAFQINVSKLPLWVLVYGAMLCFLRKAIQSAKNELLWNLVGP